MFKTQILVKDVTVDAAWTSAQGFISADPHLAPLQDMITSSSFTVDGYVGVSVPLGTDAFVQKFVDDKCLQVIGDVAKLDPIGRLLILGALHSPVQRPHFRGQGTKKETPKRPSVPEVRAGPVREDRLERKPKVVVVPRCLRAIKPIREGRQRREAAIGARWRLSGCGRVLEVASLVNGHIQSQGSQSQGRARRVLEVASLVTGRITSIEGCCKISSRLAGLPQSSGRTG
jgi:hypothetical protein